MQAHVLALTAWLLSQGKDNVHGALHLRLLGGRLSISDCTLLGTLSDLLPQLHVLVPPKLIQLLRQVLQ